jgi:hypothetical protein
MKGATSTRNTEEEIHRLACIDDGEGLCPLSQAVISNHNRLTFQGFSPKEATLF